MTGVDFYFLVRVLVCRGRNKQSTAACKVNSGQLPASEPPRIFLKKVLEKRLKSVISYAKVEEMISVSGG
jgi:hypothetical protein